jgi:hypothetical protein
MVLMWEVPASKWFWAEVRTMILFERISRFRGATLDLFAVGSSDIHLGK